VKPIPEVLTPGGHLPSPAIVFSRDHPPVHPRADPDAWASVVSFLVERKTPYREDLLHAAGLRRSSSEVTRRYFCSRPC